MSPPIRDGSGSSIGSIRLGDGSEISEVRTGAGDVLFSAIPDSVVSRWTFDNADTSGDTAIDVFGDNDGTIEGATTGIAGELNEAYSFDGTDDRVSFGNIPEVGGESEFSISVWVYEPGDYPEAEIYFGAFPNNSNNIIIGTNNNAQKYYIRVESGDTRVQSNNEISPPENTWTHMVLTFNSGSLKFYEDATERVSKTGGPSTAPTGLDFYCAFAGQTGEYNNVDIDDPRIYSKELSSSEVSNLYNTGSIDG